MGHMKKELFYGLSRVKAAQKRFGQKSKAVIQGVGVLGCITHLSGLLL